MTEQQHYPSRLREIITAFEHLKQVLQRAGKASHAETDYRAAPSPDVQELWSAVLDAAEQIATSTVPLIAGEPYDNATQSDGIAAAPEDTPATVDETSDEFEDFRASVLKEAQIRDRQTSDAAIAAAFPLWKNAFLHKGSSPFFCRTPGHTGSTIFEWLISMHPGKRDKEQNAEEKKVLKDILQPIRDNEEAQEWERELWTIARSHHCKRSFNFCDNEALISAGQSVTEIDVNAFYQAASITAPLGHGPPVVTSELDTHQDWYKCPGYAHLRTPPDLSDVPRVVQLTFADLDEKTVLPIPVANYLARDLKVDLDISTLTFWPTGRHRRHLATWAKLVGQARKTLLTAARDDTIGAEEALWIAKGVASQFLGGMTRSTNFNPMRTLNPTWWDQWVSLAHMNKLRALVKTVMQGNQPLAAHTDAVFYAADHAPFHPKPLEFSDQPGKWKTARWGTVGADDLDACLTALRNSSPENLRKQVIKMNNERLETQP